MEITKEQLSVILGVFEQLNSFLRTEYSDKLSSEEQEVFNFLELKNKEIKNEQNNG